MWREKIFHFDGELDIHMSFKYVEDNEFTFELNSLIILYRLHVWCHEITCGDLQMFVLDPLTLVTTYQHTQYLFLLLLRSNQHAISIIVVFVTLLCSRHVTPCEIATKCLQDNVPSMASRSDNGTSISNDMVLVKMTFWTTCFFCRHSYWDWLSSPKSSIMRFCEQFLLHTLWNAHI